MTGERKKVGSVSSGSLSLASPTQVPALSSQGAPMEPKLSPERVVGLGVALISIGMVSKVEASAQKSLFYSRFIFLLSSKTEHS